MSEDRCERHEVVLKILGPVPEYAECEVVRCRECKYNAFLGKEPNWCDAIECFIKPDDFCAWGVRK